MATKYKNIVGTGFPDYVQKQIDARGKILQNEGKRSTSDLQWLTNRNGWVRMSSGAKLKPQGAALTQNEIANIVQDARLVGNTSANAAENTALTGTVQNTLNLPQPKDKRATAAQISSQEAANNIAKLEDQKLFNVDLAKQNVLQGGTVSIDQNGNVTTKNTFDTRKTSNRSIDGTYKTGATDNLGRKPMPGITNITVGTGGKWQTLLQAEVEFICYDLDQLDIMSKLYMSLGVHVFIEWAHTPHIGSNGKVNLADKIIPINFFNESTEYFKNKKKLLQTLSDRKKETSGNYGGLLGRVYNFDWSSNPDGSYSCKSYIMGPGGMVESLRINKSSRLDFDSTTTENNTDKFHSDLENALTSIKNLLYEKRIGGIIQEKQLFGGSGRSFSFFGQIDASNFFEKGLGRKKIGREDTQGISELESYGDLLNKIYGSSNYPGPKFSAEGKDITLSKIDFKGNDFSKYGNAHQILSNLAPDKDNLTPLDAFGLSAVNKFFNGYSVITSYLKDGLIGTTETFNGSNEYITFGHLMMLIQHLCIFVETENGVNISQHSSKVGASLYLDFHPDNTKVQTGVVEVSIDDGVCLVPFKINTNSTHNSPATAFDAFMWPLNTNATIPYVDFEDSSKEPNVGKNLASSNSEIQKINKINSKCPSYDGKLFNILINLDFAISTLRRFSDSDPDNEVNLIEYIYALLEGINVALGKVNNFRVFFDDNSHTLRIVDEHRTDTIDQFLTIPNLGLKSLTYDYSYSSKLSPKLAPQIVIASQAADKGIGGAINKFPDDVLSYQKLNGDVRDRFSNIILPPLPGIDKEDAAKQKRLKGLQKLFDLFYDTYSLTLNKTTEGYVRNVTNMYADLQGIHKKFYASKSHSLVIPLEYSLTMDGIEGILPYSAFLLPNNRLPLRYRGKVGFIVFSISHDFNNNQWTTSLRGQTILIGGNPPIDDRPVHEESKIPPVLPINTPVGDGNLDPGYTPVTPNEYTTTPKENPPKGIPAPGDVPALETNANIPVGLNLLEGNRSISLAQLNPRPNNNIPGLIEFIKPEEGLVFTAYPDPTNRTEGQGFIQAANTFQETFTINGVINETRTIKAGQWYRWTIGYGSHTITAENGQFRYVKQGDVLATQEEAERDLERNLQEVHIPIARQSCEANGLNFDNLPNKVKIVFVDFTYNYDGHLYNNVINSYKNGGKQGLINELKRRMSLPGQVKRRRQVEINLLQD